MRHCSVSVASVDICVVVSDASGNGQSVIFPSEHDVGQLDVVVIAVVVTIVVSKGSVEGDTSNNSK